MQIEIFSMKGKKENMMDVPEDIFGKSFNEPLIHQVITACLANRRQGTHQQKTRAEVSGSGTKPWRQKGTGRARAGSKRSPLWRHGGKVFAARLGIYDQKINKKMYRSAICSIFSKLLKDNRLVVIEKIDIEPKTKQLMGILESLNAKEALIIIEKIEENIVLASRNLVKVDVASVNAIDPVKLLSHEKIIITKNALEKLNEDLKQ